MRGLIPPWAKLLAILALLAGVWWHGRSTGADAVQARWDADALAQERAAQAHHAHADLLRQRHQRLFCAGHLALHAIAAACEARPATIRAAAANGLHGRFFTDPEG